ncbi:MAG: hypothetical protein FD153_1970 [Rhodospirillaceae bacterium]|nr:MAG: hypothetical protein FD153_1970 [Rhodospirillaceae bacterium]
MENVFHAFAATDRDLDGDEYPGAPGCNALQRLSEVGSEPSLSPIQNPVEKPGYRLVSLPIPALVLT